MPEADGQGHTGSVLVLGANGFVASRLIRRLLMRGMTVLGVSRAARPPLVHHRFHYVSATLDNKPALHPLIEQSQHIIHCAWDSVPGTTIRQPVAETLNNLLPTLNFLEGLQTVSPRHLMYLSSGGALYAGTNDQAASPQAGYSEACPPAPLSNYGAGKLATEQFLSVLSHESGHRVTVVRPANVYGPGQHMRRHAGVVAAVLHSLKHGTVFHRYGTGQVIRDFLYIEDLNDLLLMLLDVPPSAGCQVFNAGSGNGCRIIEVCRLAEQITGRTLQVEQLAEREVDAPSVILNIDKAKACGWQPKVSLEQGLRHTWQWIQGSSV